MRRVIWSSLLLVAVVIAMVMIYEDLTLDSHDTYGGGASYSTTLVVGSAPKQFGIERESYWTDGAGELVISFGDAKQIPSGYSHHVSASVLMGELSFPLLVRPWLLGALVLAAASALGYFKLGRRSPASK